MKRIIKHLLIVGLFIFMSQQSYAHCEIPCGIFQDEVRIDLLKEHFTTIEKSMNQINELQAEESINYNQLIRWVNNKEEHANKVQEIVSQYFLHQRIKPVGSDSEKFGKYQKELLLLHHLSVYSMKSKQSTDVKWIEKLRATIEKFEASYFEGKHRHNPDGSHKH